MKIRKLAIAVLLFLMLLIFAASTKAQLPSLLPAIDVNAVRSDRYPIDL